MVGYSDTRGYVADKFDNLTDYGLIERIIAAEKKNPQYNKTELAQAVAGGYKGDRYPLYIRALKWLNKNRKAL